LANAYVQLGDYQEAIESYKQAELVFREIGFSRGIASTLIGMALIYENLKQYKTALEVLQEYLNISEKENNIAELANAYNNIGIIYNNILADTLTLLYGVDYADSVYVKKVQLNIPAAREALKYHQLALEKRRDLKDTRAIGVSLLNLGSTYLKINEFSKAKEIYQEWLNISDKIANDDQSASINQALGKIYVAEGNLEKAIESFYTALQYANKINKRIYLRDITDDLADLYEKTGNYRKAYEYHKMHAAYKDSLLTDESRRLVHEMQVKFETDAKEAENKILRQDQLISETKLKQQKNTIYFFLFVIIFVIAFVVMLIKQNAVRKKNQYRTGKEKPSDYRAEKRNYR
jgi:tetratricopeptide (TPR) repeat protein